MKKNVRKFWLVEMTNNTDRRDDEVWKIRAVSKEAAKIVARSSDRGRFSVGSVVPARGGSKAERDLARSFRTYCTRVFQ